MSEQARLWSRYHAAALQTCDAPQAAKRADEALAEYNKRFEVLSKLEAELTAAHELLTIRGEQVYVGTSALMDMTGLVESWTRDGKVEPEWMRRIENLTKCLRLVGNKYTIVPNGMDPNDPKLRNP